MSNVAPLRVAMPEGRPPAPDAGAPPANVWTLGQLLAQPELYAPPVLAMPRLAWKQRVTLLSAREKVGKSTLLTHAAAALSRGTYCLGERVEPGTVLWVYFEGHQGDVVRAFYEAKGAPDSIYIAKGDAGKWTALHSLLATYQPAVTIIDTLVSFSGGLVTDSWRAEQWTPVMNRFSSLAQEHDTAIVLVHHSTKSGSGYADSRAIGAGVDMLLEMDGEAGKPTPRTVKGVGRWDFRGFSFRKDGDQLLLTDPGQAPVDVLVLDYITKHPGVGSTKLRQGVGKRAVEIDEAVTRLLNLRMIVDLGDKNGRRFHPGNGLSQGAVPTPLEMTSGQGFGTAPCPDRNILSDIALSSQRDTTPSPVPDTSIGTGGEGEADGNSVGTTDLVTFPDGAIGFTPERQAELFAMRRARREGGAA